MPQFQLHDTVALKADTALVGTVDRTSYFDSEPLDDCLIIAHVEVPLDILNKFCASGVPPKGYLFVVFAHQEQGSSLVSEDDVVLLDRVLDLGDVVKGSSDELLGTVVDVSNSYVLEPVWQPSLTGTFGAQVTEHFTPTNPERDQSYAPSDPWTNHPRPYRIIPNVPFEELKRAQDFFEGDYVIQDEWVGVVDACELAVVVLLENETVVVVQDPEELLIPIPDFGKPLVSLPEFDGIRRPDYVSAAQGWSQLIPPEDLQTGQMVVTSHRNIRNGRWLRGSYDDKVKPQGRILMVRTRRTSVRWLACNAYAPESSYDITKPQTIPPYENLNNFPKPSELRRDKRLALYDPSKHVTEIENRMRLSSGREAEAPSKRKPSLPSINLSSTFTVGDRVKFRDAAGAAVKYQGQLVDGVTYGRFDRILPAWTFDFDLNEFKIVRSEQHTIVRWQDGTTTKMKSVEMRKFNIFETDLVPADIVVSREGMKQRPDPDILELFVSPLLTDFNEMTFFEKPHDLFPKKVGIIQTVDPSERVAQVRWFSDPGIRLTNFGNGLGGESRFGPLAGEVEDVSLFEVMSFPGLTRRLRDIVLIAPKAPSSRALALLAELEPNQFSETYAIGPLSQMGGLLAEILDELQHIAKASMKLDEPVEVTEEQVYKSHRHLDWIGEIVELGEKGTVTVRIDTGTECKDVLLEHDQVLCCVDDQYYIHDLTEDPMDIDDSVSASDGSSAWSGQMRRIATESVEYEGGSRIDNDSGDENWESDEDSPPKLARSQSVSMHDDVRTDPKQERNSDEISNEIQDTAANATRNSPEDSLAVLRSHLPSAEPAAFAVLEGSPPKDQFKQNLSPSTSASFLKRIAKEHRILSNSLPKHEIYVRTYENRLDLLRCLIIGPVDTPYEHAPFLIDLHLGPTFPQEPPSAHFHSWTSGMGRINPNLYEEGKICLSLLGTWPGKSVTEGWTEKATILQILVSLQGLVFVKAPFYNEAGFDESEQEGLYRRESLQYAEKAFVMARGFVSYALTGPIPGLEDVLAWLHLTRTPDNGLKLLRKVVERGRCLIAQTEKEKKAGNDPDEVELLDGSGVSGDKTKIFLKPLSKGAMVMLQKTLKGLEAVMQKEAL